ncbi:bifunctional 2-polyprenyl-6-hydroxyphenol methylase/3-demethylubiquinol 3-O-methyltransferase UbiG [Massilia sp. Root351]|jgi:O-antigen chain-terminating methyltransferase|uniref:class I SAM-dependent methyltransferase n=1 Tax=Massilia sp. Root351 TaxID=1736522 RepID=UPI0009EBA7B4|nr:class I SAM-dependent methyltransferase [Massilia sp. Root351]
MSGNFYRAFEDRYRGSRDTIKQRLAAYGGFLQPLAALARAQAAPALDLGCGRGEWLELLAEQGIAARGVDLDAGMLAACHERGLAVEQADALASLRARPDNSLALVSAFHLVEHLPFALVQEILVEAQRALMPGGLLVLETPNPENLTVGASSFYLDPSHERPLPPQLLDFAVEFAGFSRRKIVRLQEEARVHTDAPVDLLTVLEGVSPDYAVVAQKSAADAVLAPFEAAFDRPYGATLAMLAQRHDTQLAAHLARIGEALQALRGNQDAATASLLAQLDAASGAIQRTALQQQALAGELAAAQAAAQARDAEWQHAHHDLAARLGQLAARSAHNEERIIALLGSSSWRVTAPLRWAGHQARRVRGALREGRVGSGLRRRAHGPLLRAMRAVMRRPALKRLAMNLLRHLPALRARLQRVAYEAPPPAAPPAAQLPAGELPPRAQQAYQQLKQALAARKH